MAYSGYNTRFFFRFESQSGREFRIDIKKNGYTGSAAQRALGQSPVLKRESGDNGIHGTSLEIYAECATDGEFAELYTSDAHEFLVVLSEVSGSTTTPLWHGFITPELYSEPEIAPPYDVQIVATDGLGELKNYTFPSNGRQSLRSHLQTILSYSGLNTYATDIIVVSSLRATTPTISAATMLADTYVNLDYLSEGNCYDALEAILRSLHLNITRHDDKWLLMRDTDVSVSGSTLSARNASGTSVTLAAAQYGTMQSYSWWPVGQMQTEIVPAKKTVTVGYPYRTAISLFQNPETANPYCGVNPPPINVDDCPGWSSIGDTKSYTAGSAYYGNHARIGKLQQTITVEAQGSYSAPDQMSLVLSLAGIGLVDGPNTAKIAVKVFVTGSGGSVTYLKKKKYGEGETDVEWTSSESDFELTVPVEYASGPRSASFTDFEIILPYLPGGDLTLQLDGTDAGSGITFLVGAANLTKPTINGYQDVISIDNAAREAEKDIEISFGDAPYTANALANIYNILTDSGGNLSSAWATSQFSGEFFSVIAMDYALHSALPRLLARGNLNVPTGSTPPAVFLNPDGIVMLYNTWDWHLRDDELDVNMTSVPAASVTIEAETITQMTDQQAASYAGGYSSGSSGSGGSSYSRRSLGKNFFEAVEENAETVGAKALYDLYIVQTEEDEEQSQAEVTKNISAILRHLSLQTVNAGEENEYTVLLSDITFASSKNVVAGGIGSSSGGTTGGTLAGLADVTLSNLAAGNVLVYNANSSHWENTALSLGALSDVTIGTPSDGQSLVYNATTGKWEPRMVSGGSGSGGTGTVVSVGLTMPTGFTVSGSPVTTSGTLAVSLASGYAIPTSTQLAKLDYWSLLNQSTIGTNYAVTVAAGLSAKNLYPYNSAASVGTAQVQWASVYATNIYEGGTALASKYQALLVSGTNIKTVNGQSLLGSGNITIEGGSTVTVDDAMSSTSTNPVQNKVIYTALSGKQATIDSSNKLAASLVSGLADVATSGSYGDLTGTPDLADVATSGDYDDLLNKPSIPTVNDATLTVKMNGATKGTFTANASSDKVINLGTVLTEHQSLDGYATTEDLTDKADLVADAVSGNFAGLDSDGNITDSGYNYENFLTQHQSLGLVASTVDGVANAATTDGNTYINLLGGGAKKAGVNIVGASNVTVTSDAMGKITVTGPNLTTYMTKGEADALFAHSLVVSSSTPYKLLLRDNMTEPNTLSEITGSNIVSVIGAVAVARAIADADGNTITSSYLRKNIDDTMSANLAVTGDLTVGTSNTAKALTVYGTQSISGTLTVGGDATLSGSVAIGAQADTTTAKTLSVYGRNNSSTPALKIYGVASSSTRYLTSIYRDASYLQISSAVYVTGNISATGNVVAGVSSDRRLKKDIRSISLSEAADLLSVLNPVVFHWNEKAAELGELHGVARGFIADEYLNLLPNAGRKMWGEYDAIDYNQVIPYLVAGWQQQNLRIRILEGEIAVLKEDNQRLRRMCDVV